MLDRKTRLKLKNKNLSSYLKLLDNEQKMKLWIKTLLSAQASLPEIIKSIDKIIEINASSLSFITDIYNTEKSTYAQVERVIDLTERKNKLLNLFLISKTLFSSVCEEDQLFLKRKFIFNWTAEDLSVEYNVSIRTVFRRIEKLIENIYEKVKTKNWSTNFINLQVKDESWLQEKFYQFVKDSMPSSFIQEEPLSNRNFDTFTNSTKNNINLEEEESLNMEKI